MIYVAFIPTSFNLVKFTLNDCGVEQGLLFYYFYFLEILFSSWLAIYLIKKIITSKKGERAMTTYFSIGAIGFLASFSGANVVASITERWEILQYGLFGMPFFMAFLVYLIVRYKAFNIKLLGAEALIVAMIVLTGSQFFFIQNPTNRVLTTITFVLITFFGWLLVKSVAREIKQKEEIDRYAEELGQAKEKLEASYRVEKQAKEELERIGEAKSQFIMATQHHLRTPLTALKGYLSMAIEGDFGRVNKILKEKLGFCFESTNRLIKLVNEFLDISKLQLGRDILEVKEASITEILQDVIAEVKPEADKKSIYLTLGLPPGSVAPAMADPIKIREALYNLIDNAVKYTEKGGVRVSLEAGKGEAGKNTLLITVVDTGIGMSKQEVADVFGRQFERGKEAKKVYALGRGIGLYIAASIIKAHKGRIWAESLGQGKGSSFFVELVAK
ncbi:MAG: HAMP domain-containing sensor histidine kinase [Candidatus Pacebacteria bacterium]|nr:HAMP domain-containing sensor histidine kinase [Candidatus Paceibacterota bacterium]